MIAEEESWEVAVENKQRGEKVREDILQCIIGYIEKHGYPPSVREICKMTGLKSTSSVQGHLEKLRRDGKIETDAGFNAPRAIRIPGYKFVKAAE